MAVLKVYNHYCGKACIRGQYLNRKKQHYIIIINLFVRKKIRRVFMYLASDLRKGLKFEIDGEPYVIVGFEFKTGSAFSTTFGWQWPVLLQYIPAEKSI